MRPSVQFPCALALAGALCGVPMAAAHAQNRHEFTATSLVETRGDTVYWMRTVPASKGGEKARHDTTVYLIRKDSSVRIIRPGPAHEVPEGAARQFRFLLSEAIESGALRQRLKEAVP
jgi:hypothetical protein